MKRRNSKNGIEYLKTILSIIIAILFSPVITIGFIWGFLVRSFIFGRDMFDNFDNWFE